MAEPQRFRKKPVVVEAIQWTDHSVTDDVRAFVGSDLIEGGALTPEGAWLAIPTLEGDLDARLGDWIIRGVQGEFYPCKPDIFEQTYEAAPTSEEDSS